MSLLSPAERHEVQLAERRRLFERMLAAKKEAERTDSFAAYDFAGRCYRDFMRAYLDDAECQVVELEDQLAQARRRGRK